MPARLLQSLSVVERGASFFLESLSFLHCKKGFVILTIVFLTRIATVDMALWDDTRLVPCDSHLWAIQCTWSSYRNN